MPGGSLLARPGRGRGGRPPRPARCGRRAHPPPVRVQLPTAQPGLPRDRRHPDHGVPAATAGLPHLRPPSGRDARRPGRPRAAAARRHRGPRCVRWTPAIAEHNREPAGSVQPLALNRYRRTGPRTGPGTAVSPGRGRHPLLRNASRSRAGRGGGAPARPGCTRSLRRRTGPRPRSCCPARSPLVRPVDEPGPRDPQPSSGAGAWDRAINWRRQCSRSGSGKPSARR